MRDNTKHYRHIEYYQDGSIKTETEFCEPVNNNSYPQLSELLFGFMAITFVVLVIFITGTNGSNRTINTGNQFVETSQK